ncbi:GNAT family N-acetyltransferase [Flavobacterium aciduliphilum]|nr:GNAT family N-acetyltransferase [Flavobacterium aciduliphilum]
MEISIRPFQTQDTPALLDIINEAITNSTALYDYHPRTLEHQQKLFEIQLHKGFPINVAVVNELVVGYGTYSDFRYKDAYQFTVEHSVYVHQNYKGNGIGKRLLKSLVDSAKAQNKHTIIGVIDAENEESIMFHKLMGFEIVGTIRETGFKFGRWLDSIFMQKML